ncbi:serine-type endopeptidase activity [Nesidiocoris tenuis]|uniref:Serine-type endopeptidase activity n=1 Tax=Nesidiocoris tenuis TaxID=355587 RepID=A0ABN7AHD7_9HEMI|nr:serine-type endopeptidase activity [Nesidiocoris tenuis]
MWFPCCYLVLLITLINVSLSFTAEKESEDPPRYCGIARPNPTVKKKAKGAEETAPHEFPWIVKIYHNKTFKCAGSLISDEYILTAASCVTSLKPGASTKPVRLRGSNLRNTEKRPPTEFVLEFGAHAFKETYENIVRRFGVEVLLYPNYDTFDIQKTVMQTNDIALIRVKPIVFNKKMYPICLPKPKAKIREHSNLLISGWSSRVYDLLKKPLDPSKNLMKSEVTKISFPSCKKHEKASMFLDPLYQLTKNEVFCLTGKNNFDGCTSDYGGPAMVKSSGDYYHLAGIASWRSNCATNGNPSFYAQVTKFLDFILASTKNSKFLPSKDDRSRNEF